MSVPTPPSLRRLKLLLWHRLLTPGWIRPTPAARLRGWARVLHWSSAGSWDERRRLVGFALATPIRAWRQAAADVQRFGAEVHEVAGVPPRAQRRQLWWLAVRHGLSAESYIDYELYRPERRRHAAAYLEQREHARVVWWLLAQRRVDGGFPGRDKSAFPDWCRAHGIPGVPTLLEYERGECVGSMFEGEPARSLPAGDLFAKPSDSQYGNGSMRWRYDGAGGWTARDGQIHTAAELLRELENASRGLEQRNRARPNRLLVQPCLRNHRDLLPLTPGALCTVRIMTCRAPGEEGEIVFAAFRMACGDAPADNFHFGGIIAPVDLSTGRVGPALRRREHVLVPVERHPDTGAVIAGHQMPCWQEAKALALRAFAAAPERVTVGWDIAITDDGPVLIEGNTASHPDIAQATSRKPLSETPYPAALDAHVGLVLGAYR